MHVNFHLGWPQGILLGLLLLSDVVAIRKHGQPMGKYDARLGLVMTLAWVGLLYWGGFFS